jgi:cell division protein FtsZ
MRRKPEDRSQELHPFGQALYTACRTSRDYFLSREMLTEARIFGAYIKRLEAKFSLSPMPGEQEQAEVNVSLMPEVDHFARIKVLGVGGGGCNAVNRMIAEGLQGVEFVAIDTDAQALGMSHAPNRVRIGDKSTKGIESGGDPGTGAKAAEESSDELYELIYGSDMVFIVAGMGSGTGSGGAPVIANIAKKTGAVTIGVVTKPFNFEGTRRRAVAEEGIERLKEQVDTLIAIPNDRLLEIIDRRASIQDAFRIADDALRQVVQGISEPITVPGLINLDIADVQYIMVEGGAALMAIGRGQGDNKAVEAAEMAIASSLPDVTIDGARSIFFNVTGGPDLSLFDVSEAAVIIRKSVHPEANVVFGSVFDENMSNEVRITVIATGFDAASQHRVSEVRNAAGHPSGVMLRKWTKPAPSRGPLPRRLDGENLDIVAFLRKYVEETDSGSNTGA